MSMLFSVDNCTCLFFGFLSPTLSLSFIHSHSHSSSLTLALPFSLTRFLSAYLLLSFLFSLYYFSLSLRIFFVKTSLFIMCSVHTILSRQLYVFILCKYLSPRSIIHSHSTTFSLFSFFLFQLLSLSLSITFFIPTFFISRFISFLFSLN